ncbi:hypothetical protein NQ314_018139, partial [Rhamnusium bicolor]
SYLLFKSPGELDFKGDIANNWKLWKQKFNLYLVASDRANKTDDNKIAILLNFLGDEGILYNTFEFTQDEDEELLNIILREFDNCCNPVKNLVYEHYKFVKRDQGIGEAIQICRSMTSVATQKEIIGSERVSVCAVKSHFKHRNYSGHGNNSAGSTSWKFKQAVGSESDSNGKSSHGKAGNKCHRCGLGHLGGKCLAYN